MYTSIESQILAITGGKCPYKHKVCDGLCNNCGIIPEVLYSDSDVHITKIAPSRQGCICTFEDLDILEDRAMGN